MKNLIKTDKNGSKYWEVVCDRCEGHGRIEHYDFNEDGVCFKCKGAGQVVEKEYTEAHAEKLRKQRERRQEKREEAVREEKAARLAKWRQENPVEAAAYDERQRKWEAGVNQAQADKTNSRHVGVVAKREDFLVTLDGVIITEGHYGYTYIHKFRSDGNVMVWFGSKQLDAADGDTFKVRATVKAHDEYNGVMQTILTRVAKV